MGRTASRHSQQRQQCRRSHSSQSAGSIAWCVPCLSCAAQLCCATVGMQVVLLSLCIPAVIHDAGCVGVQPASKPQQPVRLLQRFMLLLYMQQQHLPGTRGLQKSTSRRSAGPSCMLTALLVLLRGCWSSTVITTGNRVLQLFRSAGLLCARMLTHGLQTEQQPGCCASAACTAGHGMWMGLSSLGRQVSICINPFVKFSFLRGWRLRGQRLQVGGGECCSLAEGHCKDMCYLRAAEMPAQLLERVMGHALLCRLSAMLYHTLLVHCRSSSARSCVLRWLLTTAWLSGWTPFDVRLSRASRGLTRRGCSWSMWAGAMAAQSWVSLSVACCGPAAVRAGAGCQALLVMRLPLERCSGHSTAKLLFEALQSWIHDA